MIVWDLYNEPGNSGMGNRSLPLVQAVFAWARDVDPRQPLTMGVWNDALSDLNQVILSRSDIVTYHAYPNIDFSSVDYRRQQPDASEVADTDHRIHYSAGWTAWTGDGPRCGTLHYHNQAGGRADIPFEGTGVYLVFKVGPDCGLAELLIIRLLCADRRSGSRTVAGNRDLWGISLTERGDGCENCWAR